MIVVLAAFLITLLLGAFGLDYPKWLVMIGETILLLLFGFAWLVKGQLFKFSQGE